jgi:LytS/YehU family sensor histidine kinase
VENPVEDDVPKKKGAGMGMEIVRKRLQAIYGSDGDVKATMQENTFKVILFLPTISQR